MNLVLLFLFATVKDCHWIITFGIKMNKIKFKNGRIRLINLKV